MGTRKHIAGLAAGLGALAAAPAARAAIAPGYIDYEPLGGVASVPTLGEWTLALLALLLAVVAYRALRGRVGGRLMSHLLLAGGVTAGGLAGGDLMSRAWAAEDLATVQLDQRGGGTAMVFRMNDDVQVVNTSGVALRIRQLRAGGEGVDWILPSSTPRCQAGNVLQNNQSCYVHLRSQMIPS